MACNYFKIGKVEGIICGRGPRMHVCGNCGRPGDILCDYPKGDGTCDRKLCRRCSTSVGPDRDYCRSHPMKSIDTLQGNLWND